MKTKPLTKFEANKLEKVITNILKINTSMQEVLLITKKKQVIIFHDEYPFEFLYWIEKFFNEQGVPARTLTGSLTVPFKSCTVKIFRQPDLNWKKKK